MKVHTYQILKMDNEWGSTHKAACPFCSITIEAKENRGVTKIEQNGCTHFSSYRPLELETTFMLETNRDPMTDSLVNDEMTAMKKYGRFDTLTAEWEGKR
jgi:histone deacetylase complex regulatory component SIN3